MLGAGGDAVPSVLHVGADGSALVGEGAEDCGPVERDRVARGFVQRIGDLVPFVLGGDAYPAHELFVTVISWVIDEATQRIGGAPEHVAVTQPAGWSRYQLGVSRSAMDQFGLRGVTLVPELTAAALDYAAARPVGIGDLIVVGDLGGSGYRAAVLRRAGETGFELLARPERAEPATDPGEAVFARVRSELGAELDRVDLTEPGAWAAALALRRECVGALEILMANPQAAVSLRGLRTGVTVTRGQLADWVRPAAQAGAELIRRALRSAGVHPWQLSAVLLVGGAAQVPLVPRMISTELRRPAVVGANPKASTARGAAVAATHVVWPGSVTGPGAASKRELGRVATGADETVVLFTGPTPDKTKPRPDQDLDELAGELPPRPSLDLSPLPFDLDQEPVGEQPMWKRIALGGGAVGGIVLVLALVAWFVFGPGAHSAPSQQPVPAPSSVRTTGSPGDHR